MEFRIACDEDMLSILDMICICFGEPVSSVKFYLENKFMLDRCAVCVVDDRVVSSLSMLPMSVCINNKMEPAHYIYAAATLPEYRKRGCMSKLIEFSCDIAGKRGEKYSTLLPENDGLYQYYSKLGYEEFFKVRYLKVKNDELKSYIDNINSLSIPRALTDEYDIYKLRQSVLKNINGSVIWDKESIDYAIRFNKHYGGSIVFSGHGYALCFIDKDDCVMVTEIICQKYDIKNLLREIYMKFPGRDYKFRVPVDMDIFKGDGETKKFGMIKRISDGFIDLDNCKNPYLGLALD